MTSSQAKRNFILSIVVFFAVHSVASFYNLYRSLTWVDIPAHFLAGIVTAAALYWFFQYRPTYFDVSRNFWITALLVLGWAALIGVLWEFAEFLHDLAVIKYGFISRGIMQFGLKDTLGDLLFDLLGGLSLAIFVKLRYHR